MDAMWRLAMTAMTLAALAALAALAGCDKPRPAQWIARHAGRSLRAKTDGPCDAGAFYLDTANLSVKSGTPYVILQTRYADGRTGSIRAEVNCPRQKLEPTALKEAVAGSNGAPLENRMTTMGADDEKAVLQYACAKR